MTPELLDRVSALIATLRNSPAWADGGIFFSSKAMEDIREIQRMLPDPDEDLIQKIFDNHYSYRNASDNPPLPMGSETRRLIKAAIEAGRNSK